MNGGQRSDIKEISRQVIRQSEFMLALYQLSYAQSRLDGTTRTRDLQLPGKDCLSVEKRESKNK